MITVDAALAEIFALVGPLDTETVPLARAAGRVLAAAAGARRDQPPFRSSAMDGYAVIGADVAPGAEFTVIGEAAAGHRFDGALARGQAVRIFTGAPVPDGADRVIIQEDMTRDGDRATLTGDPGAATHIRARGADFADGDRVAAPRLLRAADIALLAAMNVPRVTVTRRPVVALIATGDELVMPGETPRDDQIVASNAAGLAAMVAGAGAEPRVLPIARDTPASLAMAFDLAAGADLVVTIGGASVGDHDLVADAARAHGMAPAFHKVAMRPGKPLMAGRLGDAALLGLPGNPVSSMVCGQVFLLPAIRAMLGLGAHPAPRHGAVLACDIAENGPREHYMRATLAEGRITPCARQDSSLLRVLADADGLLIRPANDPARPAGDRVEYVRL